MQSPVCKALFAKRVTDGQLDRAYREVTTISQSFAQATQDYKHNEYQCLLAAELFANDAKWQLLMLPPGEGKTFVLLLLA